MIARMLREKMFCGEVLSIYNTLTVLSKQGILKEKFETHLSGND